ncbi:MAG TPA: hypothetical protein VJ983_05325 [candidate division Zixibacteria bacterium]|nr:hypothetical protein [candidate division Zixibacteria bacterium]
MKLVRFASSLASHSVATAAFVTLYLVVPAASGIILAALLLIVGLLTGKPGGPLFLPAVFVLTLLYSLCVVASGFVCFLITCSIQLLRRYMRVAYWVPVISAFPLFYGLIDLFYKGSIFLSAILSVMFITYWLTYAGADTILSWIRQTWTDWRANRGRLSLRTREARH